MRLEGLIAEASLRALGLEPTLVGTGSVDGQGSEVEVHALTMDSRSVTPGVMFACVPGTVSDGHDFAAAAVRDGAVALLCERELDVGVPQLRVSSVRRALGPVCDAVLGHPSRDLTIAAVTGTNGKTTTCAFLDGVFEAAGWASTTIGTLTQPRTTPEAPDLQLLLADWRDRGGRAVAMEVSSHALDQHRTDAVHFDAGIFTNLTPEHLDYHHTMDAYFEAKARLFERDRVGVAVVHRGDPWGVKLLERLRSGPTRYATYAFADASDVELTPGGSSFEWDGRTVTIAMGGRFNVLNALAAATCARSLGIDTEAIVRGLQAVQGVKGRFERVDTGQSFTVIVDYAHTPDGLAKVLAAARELTEGRILAVFGAGGDRDHEKRPLMGATGAELADLVIVTSDNPRHEDPDAIIEQIVAGTTGRDNVVVDPDRASAIARVVAAAQPGDVVVIAGKGHELGQDLGDRVVAFDDAEVARAALVKMANKGSSQGSASD